MLNKAGSKKGFMDDVVDREQEIADQSTKPSVPTTTEPISEYSQPEEMTASSNGENFGAGMPSNSDSDDYYVNPKDYENDDEYARELIMGLQQSIDSGGWKDYLHANGYAAEPNGVQELLYEALELLGPAEYQKAMDEITMESDHKHEISQKQETTNIIDSKLVVNYPYFQDIFEAYLLAPENVIRDVERPRGFLAGIINASVDSLANQGLTNEELQLAVEAPSDANTVRKNSTSADTYVEKHFEDGTDGDVANAYRHAIWAAINCNELGANTAAKFVRAHENIEGFDAENLDQRGSSSEEHLAMDLHNNALGIAIYSVMKEMKGVSQVDTDELAAMVYDIVVVQGRGEWLFE